MENNKDVIKMLEYLEEIKNAVREGQVDRCLFQLVETIKRSSMHRVVQLLYLA